VIAVEAGRNKATTLDTFSGLAAGLGLTQDELTSLKNEELSVAAAAARIRSREPGLPKPIATAD
jgi:hypothetical protein